MLELQPLRSETGLEHLVEFLYHPARGVLQHTLHGSPWADRQASGIVFRSSLALVPHVGQQDPLERLFSLACPLLPGP
jgi:hypothetical protein